MREKIAKKKHVEILIMEYNSYYVSKFSVFMRSNKNIYINTTKVFVYVWLYMVQSIKIELKGFYISKKFNKT